MLKYSRIILSLSKLIFPLNYWNNIEEFYYLLSLPPSSAMRPVLASPVLSAPTSPRATSVGRVLTATAEDRWGAMTSSTQEPPYRYVHNYAKPRHWNWFFFMVLWKWSKTWASYCQKLRCACSINEGNQITRFHKTVQIILKKCETMKLLSISLAA